MGKMIMLKVLRNRYGLDIENQADLESSFSQKDEILWFNPSCIVYKTEIKECREYYEPHRVLGKYFIVHCSNGEHFYLRESQFNII